MRLEGRGSGRFVDGMVPHSTGIRWKNDEICESKHLAIYCGSKSTQANLNLGSLDLTLSLRALTSAPAHNSLITKGFFLNGFHALNGSLAFDFKLHKKEGKEYGVS
jgi:hypothetical protein